MCSSDLQGFSFFDAKQPDPAVEDTPRAERSGIDTFAAARTWIEQQRSQRYFLFLQVDARSANASLGGLVETLKRTGRYDSATIVFTADHGDGDPSLLDDTTLRVPLIIKQPAAAGAGRRVEAAVQHIDLLPDRKSTRLNSSHT